MKRRLCFRVADNTFGIETHARHSFHRHLIRDVAKRDNRYHFADRTALRRLKGYVCSYWNYGNVGGEVARNLLAAGHPVRGVVRETRKGETWAKRGL